MKQILFNIAWAFFKPFLLSKSNNLDFRIIEFLYMIRVSKIFGNPKLLIFGDVRAEKFSGMFSSGFSNYGLSLVFTDRESLISDWINFLRNPDVKLEIEKLQSKGTKIVYMFGGENILKLKIAGFPVYLDILKTIFKNSYFCSIPQFNKSFLERLYAPNYLDDSIQIMNAQIYNIWKSKFINFNTAIKYIPKEIEWFYVWREDFYFTKYTINNYIIPEILSVAGQNERT